MERDIIRKAVDIFLMLAGMMFRLIKDYRKVLPVRGMCSVLNIISSGYYAGSPDEHGR